MLGRKEDSNFEKSGELNTILGKGSFFEGTLTLQHSIRVDGKIKGKITTNDSLVIGKEGEIDGEITVKNAVIGGKVQGKISATGKIVLESKSAFKGEMKTAKLVIDEGAIFEGKCSMQGDEQFIVEGKKTELKESELPGRPFDIRDTKFMKDVELSRKPQEKKP